MDKKTIIIIVIVLLLLIYPSIKIGKKMKSIEQIKDEFKKGLIKLRGDGFSDKILKDLERIFRLETSHFKSGQFRETYSPGMERHGTNYPWGWSTPKTLWDVEPNTKPIGFHTMPENKTGISKTFLKFPSLYASMKTVATYLARYNNPARWYSTNEDNQERYTKVLNSIRTRLYDEIV